ncbi:Pentatricopeptide repeat-containing protein [Carex littledalei]|uniref:Pentatricopeptide repeat-containing protein n=1 Tax=Carex littledalei TaxID=544730 RepID=A0A833QU83_9POAL|nr:Pentatricopeptide repeat-containing protein [Carex littledalei]
MATSRLLSFTSTSSFVRQCLIGSPSLLFFMLLSVGLVRSGRELHGMVLKLGLAGDIYARNAMMAMYATGGYVMETSVLFDECVEFDVVSYNS